eukprot:1485706-Rhodomonas_salina.2
MQGVAWRSVRVHVSGSQRLRFPGSESRVDQGLRSGLTGFRAQALALKGLRAQGRGGIGPVVGSLERVSPAVEPRGRVRPVLCDRETLLRLPRFEFRRS